MSNAGKSLIAAALCRIFRQDGYRVVPFKSQNMALNSFITKEGLEMGRAQVVQAQAAGVEPSVSMNPILLKPTGDSVSQVIVNGEVLGNFSAQEYFAMKQSLVPEIRKAYRRLAEDADIIVIEGAGSPAEINLKERDIVNMGMARLAGAPVLLAGDIDRGGVFAQLYGTVMLLDEGERPYIKGLIINKFRGDRSILTPGLKQLEGLTGKPVLGVIPYLKIDIDDEDSLSERLTGTENPAQGSLTHTVPEQAAPLMPVYGRRQAVVEIDVIRLPRLSNFTDFSQLARIPGVSLRYVGSVREFGQPDIVILPGSKSTVADLLWLRESGLEALIKKAAAQDRAVIGICGGYQMLGQTLRDPEGVENGESGLPQFVRGIGLLPVDTIFLPEKTRTQVRGKILSPAKGFDALKGRRIEGYEIHMGRSVIREGSGAKPFARLHAQTGEYSREKEDGCTAGTVCGTYVHGIFDADDLAWRLAESAAEKKGLRLTERAVLSQEACRERQYDLLAASVRQNLDMEAVYRMLEEGV
jgi:adenosylcobyric acid synthase